MSRKIVMVVFLVALALFAPTDATPSLDAQEEATVKAVLFYSPTCPHCHDIMDNVLPPLTEQYGAALEFFYIDATTPIGGSLYSSACSAYMIPAERCGPVPMMLINDVHLLGAYEIPTQLPSLIEQGLAEGGYALPAIRNLERYYNDYVNDNANADVFAILGSHSTVTLPERSWQDRFNDDPTGNGLAVIVLGVLVLSVILLGGHTFYLMDRERKTSEDVTPISILPMVALMGVGIAGTLVLEQDSFALETVLAIVVTLMLLAAAAIIWRDSGQKTQLPKWLFPLVSVAGVLVAAYMVYIEVGNNEAVCGAVGNCNAVQQSEYATLLGILPIGVFGIIGYVVLLSVWAWAQQNPSDTRADLALFGFTAFGALFSIYLTFLEPFVIGATCAWCLTSAMIMLMLLWLQAPRAWEILQVQFAPQGKHRTRKRRKA